MTIDPLALGVRDGWPEELLVFHRQHPREAWPGMTLPWMASHWLEIHDWFRSLATGVARAGERFEGGTLGALDFRDIALSPLSQLLGVLHHHHHAETAMGFPAVAAAAPEVARAFEVLDRDHERIEPLLDRVGKEALALRRGGEARDAATLARSVLELSNTLHVHLHDEEDIVIPAIVARADRIRGF